MYKVKHLNENIDFKIDTDFWCIGITIAHYDNLCCITSDWIVSFLCFAFRYKKSKEQK